MSSNESKEWDVQVQVVEALLDERINATGLEYLSNDMLALYAISLRLRANANANEQHVPLDLGFEIQDGNGKLIAIAPEPTPKRGPGRPRKQV